MQRLLSQRLDHAEELSGDGADALRAVLDRLESALAPREPGLAELARELRWRACDRPVIEAGREATYADARANLAALDADPDTDREEHLQALVDCAQPLARLLTEGMDDVMLEALTRRYYRIRRLEGLERRTLDDIPFLLSSYEHKGARHHIAAAIADPDRLPAVLDAVAEHARSSPTASRCSPTSTACRPTPTSWPRPSCRPRWPGSRSSRVDGDRVDVRSFSRKPDGALTEDSDLRGLHPMMAQRMDLWRLENFALERLPSSPEVYVFGAQARENERDERLVAVAEVRDLTPARGEDGRIVALPELERIARQAFEAMRAVQSRRPTRERYQWNRVLLYAWPSMDFDPAEAREVIMRLARMSDGLGLEMGQLRADDRVLRFFNPAGRGVVVEIGDPPTRPLQPLDEGAQRIVSARRRGTVHPAEIVKILAPQRAEPRRDDPRRRVRRARPRRRRGGSCRSSARPPPTRRASWSA